MTTNIHDKLVFGGVDDRIYITVGDTVVHPPPSLSNTQQASYDQVIRTWYSVSLVTPSVVGGVTPATPRGFGVNLVDFVNISVSWLPPTHTGGLPLINYTVQWQEQGGSVQSLTVDATNNSVILGPLTGQTLYQMRVCANNSKGPSPWTPWVNLLTQSIPTEDWMIIGGTSEIIITAMPVVVIPVASGGQNSILVTR